MMQSSKKDVNVLISFLRILQREITFIMQVHFLFISKIIIYIFKFRGNLNIFEIVIT